MSDSERANDVNDPAARLQRSWRANADAWSRAVREHRIPSRRAGTDAAIVEAVLRTNPKRVLDLGCGEGWLARALGATGCEVTGIDASPELIAAARILGGARFEVASYAELDTRTAALEPFDVVACNFALLDADIVTPLRTARAALRSSGTLLLQTVHPWHVRGDAPYIDGWRVETFADFGEGFPEAMPWYFRTLSSWLGGIREAGFAIDDVSEPVDASSGEPLSLLIRASLQEGG